MKTNSKRESRPTNSCPLSSSWHEGAGAAWFRMYTANAQWCLPSSRSALSAISRQQLLPVVTNSIAGRAASSAFCQHRYVLSFLSKSFQCLSLAVWKFCSVFIFVSIFDITLMKLFSMSTYNFRICILYFYSICNHEKEQVQRTNSSEILVYIFSCFD